MFRRILIVVIALAMLPITVAATRAHDESKYPDWRGEWRRVAVPSGFYRGVQYDPHKPAGPGQQAPLTNATTGCCCCARAARGHAAAALPRSG